MNVGQVRVRRAEEGHDALRYAFLYGVDEDSQDEDDLEEDYLY